ncbi:MAG: hypothetical protein Phyf2KO_26750 [Phycisphaerales bacterium]
MNFVAPILISTCIALTPQAPALAHNDAPAKAIDSHGAEPAHPVHTIRVGIFGYSPVSYITNNRAEPGSPAFAAEHNGITYFFTNKRQQQAFTDNPERYIPAYGGNCAFGCSVDSIFVPDPTSFIVIDGKTHLFLKNDEVDARQLWRDANKQEVRRKANSFWASQPESKAYTGGRNVPSSGIGLEGYSPVSYFTKGKPELGDPRFAATHNGVTYHLTSQKQLEQFNSNPNKYEPQCGGWCAFGMTVEDKFPVDPTKFRVIDDKLYLYLNNNDINAHELWGEGNDRELVNKAQNHWDKVGK